MPSINRIRVNNVKYNFGTQGYDDFSMRMYGRNTLYDLANGGGKSVLMLLLMQNLIPNCTLDDKQPIEKLFRDPGNTVIHSLIEWKLDEADIKDGMRYMTTGFAAKKATGSEEERADGTAEIEYFNYCIFYRNYNKNDIVNLPLEKDNEHISYKALRNYLHDLSRNDKNLLVFIFDRKGEYQRFIADYGLYESHWEIIRGINKTEGHVRTYFESHYKTTRRVIEDLLIEEIIEKAYLSKTRRESGKTESAANLLMTIQEELRTLSEKKNDIKLYDYERELLQLLLERINSFMKLYEEKEKNSEDIGRVYVTLQNMKKNGEDKAEEYMERIRNLEEDAENADKSLELLKILKDIISYEKLLQDIERKNALLDEDRKTMSLQDKLLREKMAIREYISLKEAEAEIDRLDTEKKTLADDSGNDIYRIVQSIYKKLTDELSAKEKKSSELSDKYEKLSAEEDSKKKTLSEVYTQEAVLESRLEYINKELSEKENAYSVLSSSLSEAFIGDTTAVLEKRRADKRKADSDLSGAREKDEYIDQKTKEIKAEIEKSFLKTAEIEASLKELRKISSEAESASEKLRKICAVYLGDENASTDKLINVLEERMASGAYKLYENRKVLSGYEKRIEDIKQGRLIPVTEAAGKVMEYIATRHGKDAMSGMDYVASLPADMKEEILRRVPGLPYGVVVEDLEDIAEDTGLFAIETDNEVVLYDRESLKELRVGETEGIRYVRKESEFYLDEDSIKRSLDILDDERSSLSEGIRNLEAMQATIRDDMDFAKLYMDKGYSSLDDDIKSLEKSLDETQKKSEENESEISRFLSEKQKITELTSNSETVSDTCSRDINILEDMISSENETRKLRKESQEISNRKKELKDLELRLEAEVEEKKLRSLEISDALRSLEAEKAAIQSKWENRYQMYHVDGYAVLPGKELSELEILFDKALGLSSENRLSLEKEKLLRDTLSSNIKRHTEAVRELGISLMDLEERDKNNELSPAGDDVISELQRQLREYSGKLEAAKEEISKEKNLAAKSSGSIEYARARFKDKYNESGDEELEKLREKYSDSDEEMIRRGIADKEKEISVIKQELEKLRKEMNDFRKEFDRSEDILKLSERIIKEDKVNISEIEQLEETAGVRELFEGLLVTHDRLSKDIERAKADTMKVKLKVYDSLVLMKALELASSVRDDINVPDTAGDARVLSEKLEDVIRITLLEKERVEKSLVSMQQLKDSFIEECIERCLDVRSELDKLTHLSEITMGQEKIPMIRLSIPYVKDEFVKDRMSEYIDSVVEDMDKKESANDKQKFLSASLSMKKLFSVIVTDMSRIRLLLYKRERIKEQSRYLKYEEAVGSTGQSQGIYIQFLISIINYIAGMYSSSDGHDRAKTLFIDNPFGAAKDIYIWEPIFTLLEENKCQLIVPARGATPEITARFDINYVLGQQMTGKRTTTVVTHFSSKTKGEELEYKELDYEQQSFDFI